MAKIGDNISRLELLRMARDMVINEHIDRRAEMHNRWLAESDELWRTKRLRLPYPSIPPYPTDTDIVSRANTLLSFVEQDEGPTVLAPKPPPPPPDDIENDQKIDETKEPGSLPVPAEQHAVDHAEDLDIVAQTPPAPDQHEQGHSNGNDGEIVLDPVKYAKAKVSRDMDENTTTAGRMIPKMLRKLEKIRGNSRSDD